MISDGMVDSEEVAEAREWERERGGDCVGEAVSTVAGIFLDAAVEGFKSCAGSGLCLIETD